MPILRAGSSSVSLCLSRLTMLGLPTWPYADGIVRAPVSSYGGLRTTSRPRPNRPYARQFRWHSRYAGARYWRWPAPPQPLTVGHERGLGSQVGEDLFEPSQRPGDRRVLQRV